MPDDRTDSRERLATMGMWCKRKSHSDEIRRGADHRVIRSRYAGSNPTIPTSTFPKVPLKAEGNV